jgi:hypothetical protein
LPKRCGCRPSSALNLNRWPKIFNERVGSHEAWGAIRSAELGDGTVETRSIPETLQAIDLLARQEDLMSLYCDSIVKNKQIGIYDGAYKSVALATGTNWSRTIDPAADLRPTSQSEESGLQ